MGYMSIKYILVGGYPFRVQDGGRALCQEMVSGLKGNIKILDCLFARPTETWEEVFAKDNFIFRKNLPDCSLQIELARVDQFTQQVQWADVVYLSGGETDDILRNLKVDLSWLKYIENKTIVGTSAGAYALSKYWHYLDKLALGEGLGLINIKTIVHWQANASYPSVNWETIYDDLKQYREDLPILTLREGEYKVYIN